MYPETDVPPVEITAELIEALDLPETFDQRAASFEREYGLNRELSRLMASSPNYPLFEEIVLRYKASPALVVRTLEATPRELAREGVPVANLADHHYMGCFEMLSKDSIAKEGLPDLLRVLAKKPDIEAPEAARLAGLSGLDTDHVSLLVKEVVASKEALIRDKKERALAPLMGIVMKELRGRADGAKVSSLLKEEIERVLNK
jgi:glutamyl-tRNA(Gln) amidotransferase subunit E